MASTRTKISRIFWIWITLLCWSNLQGAAFNAGEDSQTEGEGFSHFSSQDLFAYFNQSHYPHISSVPPLDALAQDFSSELYSSSSDDDENSSFSSDEEITPEHDVPSPVPSLGVFDPDKLTIVSDLDNVLLHTLANPSEKDPDHNFFVSKQLYIYVEFEGQKHHYYLPAFFREYLLYIKSSGFNLHFYSAGTASRNIKVIEEILTNHLPGDEDEYSKTVRILSRENCSIVNTFYKKDLLPFIKKHGLNVILADDSPSVIMDEQEDHFLRVPFESFEEVRSKLRQHKTLSEVRRIFDLPGATKYAATSLQNKMRFLSFYKLLYIIGLIELSFHAAKQRKCQVPEILAEYQKNGCNTRFISNKTNTYFYEVGYFTLKEMLKNQGKKIPSYFLPVEKALFEPSFL